ncbi:MAG: hypothetical protein DRI99_04145 [Candidatus Aminicenantes bacterium]|nr:MAG: hypothetical protein DRJ11_03660 [Candidatus Aminicenantes bacterium]RLE04204.1 MAG: hypothetical protein DRI99_04145 [Candidatus Aminicenantes bacterium]HHF42274.1 polyprenyl synthetase family protein [Candidatus Aminicenantes bacterium]
MEATITLLQGWRQRIEEALEAFLPKGERSIYEAMHYAVFSGGKRYRPLLLMSAGHYYQAPEEELLPVACAVEYIHNYSLIHDDLPAMDDDDFRRGRPSLHRAFDEALALLTGDALLTLAFQVVAEAPFPPKKSAVKEEIIRWLSRSAGVEGMIGGQIRDLYFSAEDQNEAEFLEMVKKKTGNLIIFSVVAGGIIGGASSRQIQILSSFGEKLGYAFQLRDDLFDWKQDEQAAGKNDSPNFTLVFGEERTRSLLNQYLNEAIKILQEGGINSHELIYLAEMLRLEN